MSEYVDPLHPSVRKLAELRAKAWAKQHLPPRKRRRDSYAANPFVYVVQVRGFDLVKIGFSTDPARRIMEIEAGSGMLGGLVPLLRLPGERDLERLLHAHFADERLFGEWFRLSGPVANWINDVVLGKSLKPARKEAA